MGKTAEKQEASQRAAEGAQTATGARNEVARQAQTPAMQGKSEDKLVSYLCMIGHLCTDINQGALSACLPFLVMYNGYSYTSVAMLVFAANIASAVIQPLFGTIGDKRACPWFMAIGVTLAGIGIFGIGYVDDYWLVLACAMVSGIGVAMFHPEGGRLSNLAAGLRKANGMSIFAVGGNIGFFVGPLMAAAALTAFGMRGTAIFLVPALACAAVLLAHNKRFASLGLAGAGKAAAAGKRDQWGKFALVMGVISCRSVIEYGLLAFIPLFFVGVIGTGETTGSLMLSLFAIAGAGATLVSGRVSERLGVHRTAFASLALLTVCLVLFACNRSLAAAVALTVMLTCCANLFYPAMVALGMSYLPRHLGTASGISYGLVMCAGGIAEPFLGMAGDAIGLPAAILMIAAASALGLVLAVIVRRVDSQG